MYEIEQGIKIPDHKNTKAKYPWAQMKPGDSFFAPLPKGKTIRAFGISVRSAGHSALGKGMCKVITVTENGVEGVRAWRVK